uniref:Uncharacterized protein n=1 Tax=Anguilla anguilla TaxID=7936 RepID=A0A0E9VTR0_ANGAN
MRPPLTNIGSRMGRAEELSHLSVG